MRHGASGRWWGSRYGWSSRAYRTEKRDGLDWIGLELGYEDEEVGTREKVTDAMQ